ncbi:hypothetical protein GUITHDRAFT_153581, partial [Guillardia theta CCMP2712]
MRSSQRAWAWAMAGLGLCMAVLMVVSRATSRRSSDEMVGVGMSYPNDHAAYFVQPAYLRPRNHILMDFRRSNSRKSVLPYFARSNVGQTLAETRMALPLATQSYESFFHPVAPSDLGHMLEQEQAASTNEEHAEEHRCYGLVHACVNWMALNAKKMRVIVYEGGSWCTDDELASQACYNEPKTISEDHVYDIPANGETFPDGMWSTMLKTCPFLSGCSKPESFSDTESNGEMKQAMSAVLEFHRARQGMLRQVDSCCIDRQQAKLASLKR